MNVDKKNYLHCIFFHSFLTCRDVELCMSALNIFFSLSLSVSSIASISRALLSWILVRDNYLNEPFHLQSLVIPSSARLVSFHSVLLPSLPLFPPSPLFLSLFLPLSLTHSLFTLPPFLPLSLSFLSLTLSFILHRPPLPSSHFVTHADSYHEMAVSTRPFNIHKPFRIFFSPSNQNTNETKPYK